MPRINGETLRWARETAGLDLSQAAKKLGIRMSHGVVPEVRLALLESGEVDLSRSLLIRAAKQYRRPLLAFYLPEPPPKGDRGEDFRTLPEGYSRSDAAFVDALLRDVRARQSMVRAALEAEGEAETLPFVGSSKVEDGVAATVDSIRNVLHVTVAEFSAQVNPDAAFTHLRDRVENIGVFVMLAGNLGTHHTSIDVQVFRGFALADPIAPFVVINDQDARTAWSFTLLHELAHVWLGQTGVSGEVADQASERFCNDVAGEYLLPLRELDNLHLTPRASLSGLRDNVSTFASDRNLSGSLVAYRLYLAGRLDRPAWLRLAESFREMWLSSRDERRAAARTREGGPNYYVVRSHRLGGGLIGFVERMIGTGALSTSKAARILGIKGKQVRSLLEASSGKR